jgi:DNA repair ATPase RecN
MANKNTTLKELIQDIDYRLTHLEDISADNRTLMVKMIKQGNQIVEFLRRFDVEEIEQPFDMPFPKQPEVSEERKNRITSLKELLDEFMDKHKGLKELEKELKKNKADITPGQIGEA